MIEFAFLKGTKTPVHVTEVNNGIACGCVCPICDDALIAKNNCTDITNHFSHSTNQESRACRMTQLHLLAQHYFLDASFITMPSVNFTYKGTRLKRGRTSVRISTATLESRFAGGVSDVLLQTDVGPIAIEIMVTHKTEFKKASMYQKEKLPCIEYDLSSLKSGRLEDALSLLANYNAPAKWVYAWCQDELIQEHEDHLEQEQAEIDNAAKIQVEIAHQKKKKNATKGIRILLDSKSLTLPAITQVYSDTYQGRYYEREFTLRRKKECIFDSLKEIYSCQDYYLLKGTVGQHSLWIAYLLSESPHSDLFHLDGSIITRYPASHNRAHSVWKWLRHPSIERSKSVNEKRFKNHCIYEHQRETDSDLYEQELTGLVLAYLEDKDRHFKSQYHVWKGWLIRKGLFSAREWRQNPSIPKLFNKNNGFDEELYWAFDEWYVFTATKFAHFVDGYPANQANSLYALGTDFIAQNRTHTRLSKLESGIYFKRVDWGVKRLVFRSELMRALLEPYIILGLVSVSSREFWRKGSLLGAVIAQEHD